MNQSKTTEALDTKLNHAVFWPPFILLMAAVFLNFSSPDRVGDDGKVVLGSFTTVVSGANDWILNHFGWLFSTCAFLSVCVCLLICMTRFWKSGFGNVRIGGKDAKPIMSLWNWFAITICTTIAVGILFWSTSEPIRHLLAPPQFAGVEPGSRQAAVFSLSTMYLHWAFTPYALYAVASLTFAFAYYNMEKPFSLGSAVTPIFGNWSTGKAAWAIDAVCLYALVLGMAAALGTGIMMLAGGLNDLMGIPSNPLTWGIISASIVVTFVISSATGLMKGIRILSDINSKFLMALILLPLIFGPTIFLISLGSESLLDYGLQFFQRNLFLIQTDGQTSILIPDGWGKEWTVFYWAVWMAWAPITACFLGRISYGRTVNEFMLINFLAPSLFAIGWMTFFSGTAIYYQMENIVDLKTVIDSKGYEAASYEVFRQFPLAIVIILFYMTSAFICFVTSSDSNMSAMASISSSGITPENPEGKKWLKIVWGTAVGLVAWIMISFAGGEEGIKKLSNLGGFP
ncbi:MAG: BCCT family transporter, partial [Planctomycetota bacterium]